MRVNENFDRTHVTRSAGRRTDDNLHEAMEQLRKELAIMKDKWIGVVLLLLCATFVLGIYWGIHMEKTNAQTIKAYQQEVR